MSQKSSGLKAPSKIGKPSGLPRPGGIPTPSSSRAQSAIEKSARAAGLSGHFAEKYAREITPKLPNAYDIGPEREPPVVSPDDFIIGDRVFVGGTKPGHIAYIGETRFAPGEWAGVVLDQAVGKNDGSVAGVRYFQCAANHGVFSRISKLSRDLITASSSSSGSAASSANAPAGGSMKPPTGAPPRAASGLSAKHKTISGSNTSLASNTKPSPTGSVTSLPGSKPAARPGATPAPKGAAGTLRVGDRVLVSGTKPGVIRYVGTTEFAKGEWAGVELDEAQGKNDGAVAGKRYFECRPMFGLFAPVHKVAKVSAGGAAVPATPSAVTTSTPLSGAAAAQRRRPSYGATPTTSRLCNMTPRSRSGSQESLSSVGSNASSASRSRAPKTATRPGMANMSATNTALQKALKEKDEHIDQLLKERELERSEVARVASQCDEAESRMLTMKTEYEAALEGAEQSKEALQGLIDRLQQENTQLMANVEEEKRKVEDLQFTIAEEEINKDEVTEDSAKRTAEVEKLHTALEAEQAKCAKLEVDLQRWKGLHSEVKERHKDAEDSSVAYLEKIEELTHLLNTAQDDAAKAKEDGQTSSSRIPELEAQVAAAKVEADSMKQRFTELQTTLSAAEERLQTVQQQGDQAASTVSEELGKAQSELHHSRAQIGVLEAELASSKLLKDEAEAKLDAVQEDLSDSQLKVKQQEEQITDLSSKVKASDSCTAELQVEVQGLKAQLTELQAQLGISEGKAGQLEEDKSKLEKQISDLMQHSGNSTQQLTVMNQQLQDYDRKISALQGDLSDSTQKIAKLQAMNEETAMTKQIEINALISKHEQELKEKTQLIETAEANVEKANTKSAKLKETVERERDECVSKKDEEIKALNERLSKEEAARTQATTELKTHQDEMKKVQTEKESLEKRVSEVETSKAELEDRLKAAEEKARIDSKDREEKLSKLIVDNEQLQSDWDKEKSRLNEHNTQLSQQVDKHKQQVDSLNAQLTTSQDETSKLQQQLTELQQKLDQQQTQLQQQDKQMKQQTQQLAEQQQQITAQQQQMSDEQQKAAQQQQKVINDLKQDLQASDEAVTLLEEDKAELERELEVIGAKNSELEVTVEKYIQVDEINQKLTAELENAKQNETELIEMYENDKDAVNRELQATQVVLHKQQQEMDALTEQLSDKEQQLSSLQHDTTNRIESLQYEKDELELRLAELEAEQLTESSNSPNNNTASIMSAVGSKGDAKLKAELNSSLSQVDFLNSVIIEQQNKIEKLNKEIKLLTEVEEPLDATNGEYDLTERRPSRPPRMFCDICDMFDLHDTEDCPTQAADPDDAHLHTQYHADKRAPPREYCDICEVFGHSTESCDDEQTF